MEIIVQACDAFGLITVSAKKTETMCMPAPHTSPRVLHVEAAGQRYKQAHSFTYLGGVITEYPDISAEIARWSSACWMRIRRYQRELYDRPNVQLDLKIRKAKAKAIEALLYGCVTGITARTTTGSCALYITGSCYTSSEPGGENRIFASCRTTARSC